MKVCLHTINEISTNYIGGTERFIIKLAKELRDLGWSPFIVCSSISEIFYVEGIKVLGRIPRRYSKQSYNYKYISSDFFKKEILSTDSSTYDILQGISKYTEEQIIDIEADLFHFNSYISVSMIEANNILTKSIATNHDNDLELDKIWGNGFYSEMIKYLKLGKLSLPYIRKLCAPSDFYAHKYSKDMAIDVVSAKQGIHIQDFPPSQGYEFSFQGKHSRSSDETIILMPSRLRMDQKGHDIAIKACSILKENKFKFKLIITGSDKSSQNEMLSLQRMIDEYKLKQNVIINSYTDILIAYKICDIVISPERYCSYGLSISESLSMGITTILSDIPTYREIALGYPHAHFFESENPVSLAQKILATYNGDNINQLEVIRFRENNDMRDCAKRYSSLYQELLTDS